MDAHRHAIRIFAKFCIGVAIFLSGDAVVGSDMVLIHGHIYTGNPKAPWAQALAITGTRIDAVGSDQEILSRKSAKTELVDLQGRTVVPGFSDSHTHMWFGALELHGLNLSTPEASIAPEDDPEGVVSRIKAYAASHPNDKVLFVRSDFSTTPPSTPTHELLDRAVSDRPVVVHNTAEHALVGEFLVRCSWLDLAISRWPIRLRREISSATPADIPAAFCWKLRWQ